MANPGGRGGAELVQGLLRAAAGQDVLGRFDPVDLAGYLVGALLSYAGNRLLYLDRTDARG